MLQRGSLFLPTAGRLTSARSKGDFWHRFQVSQQHTDRWLRLTDFL